MERCRMTKYNVAAAVTCTAITEVEADSPEKAIEIARDRQVVLGGPMTGYDVAEYFVVDDADGEPTGLEASLA